MALLILGSFVRGGRLDNHFKHVVRTRNLHSELFAGGLCSTDGHSLLGRQNTESLFLSLTAHGRCKVVEKGLGTALEMEKCSLRCIKARTCFGIPRPSKKPGPWNFQALEHPVITGSHRRAENGDWVCRLRRASSLAERKGSSGLSQQ